MSSNLNLYRPPRQEIQLPDINPQPKIEDLAITAYQSLPTKMQTQESWAEIVEAANSNNLGWLAEVIQSCQSIQGSVTVINIDDHRVINLTQNHTHNTRHATRRIDSPTSLQNIMCFLGAGLLALMFVRLMIPAPQPIQQPIQQQQEAVK